MLNPGELVKSSSEAGGIANAILDKASERIAITQKTLTSSMESYQKASATYVEIANVQAEIAGELVRLGQENVGLAKVKAILTKCIEALVQLKAQVRKLVTYFSAMAEMLDYVETNELKKLTDQAGMVLDDNKDTFGGFQMIDMTRQIIFNSSILIRAYFSLFADIAQMWVEISAKHLSRGTDLLGELGNETRSIEAGKPSDALTKKIGDLRSWSDRAGTEIKQMADQVSTWTLPGRATLTSDIEKGRNPQWNGRKSSKGERRPCTAASAR
ncbi:hypothetical protein F5Y18DRAFT_109365 [Xylariaceae sp. FL1019]|nr:hypothetical protein F5Y18DRAFT_109365 [Xylariaceae sp. FL1019]